MGCTHEGKIEAAEILHLYDGGAYSDRGVVMSWAGATDCTSPYQVRMDPLEFRYHNAIKPGDTTPTQAPACHRAVTPCCDSMLVSAIYKWRCCTAIPETRAPRQNGWAKAGFKPRH